MFKKTRERLQEFIISSSKQAGDELLAVVSFVESSFFPIPPDFVLVWLGLRFRKDWFKSVMIATLYSVAGGIFGYLIGAWFFDIVGNYLIGVYGLESEFVRISNFFAVNGFLTLFISAFTPIPYKVFTISAGLFGLNIFVYILASVLGRFLRFLCVGFVVKKIGDRFAHKMIQYFNVVTLILGIGILVFLVYLFV